MCGIAGIMTRGDACELGDVPAVWQRIQHRGPDDCGVLVYARGKVEVGRAWTGAVEHPAVVLLHRRLSILDLATTGWQPMQDHDELHYIVFNGEIYNYLELRRELEGLGHQFRSRSDTEVLLAAYVQWGAGALARLVGMFAFAVLDLRRRVLFLARDFFGIKPLYYRVGRNSVAFASEVKSLLAFSSGGRAVNPDHLFAYLRFGLSDHGGGTLFASVQQVPPAHYLEVPLDRDGPLEPVRYWQAGGEVEADMSFDEAASRLREIFLRSVALHLRSDVPVGAALSGGIDSSSIVMAIRHLEPGTRLHTFSYVAQDERLSEERWVDLVGAAARAQVHKVRPSPQELVADLDSLTYVQDQPFGSTSLYAQYRVFGLAREHGIKVMLDGQGADEILGGYSYYLGARLASLIRAGQYGRALDFMRRCSRLPDASGLRVLAWAGDVLLPAALQRPLRKMLGKELTPAWLKTSWFVERGVCPQAVHYTTSPAALREMLRRDLAENSIPHLLRYEDRNSMAFSIESRVPFLTPELVNFVLSLPEEYIIARDGQSKAVFRAAMRGLVPDAILDRSDKIGFATPERQWLRTLDRWVSGVLASDTAAAMPFLNVAAMRQEWRHIVSGKRSFDFRVWRWINLVRWSQQFAAEYS